MDPLSVATIISSALGNAQSNLEVIDSTPTASNSDNTGIFVMGGVLLLAIVVVVFLFAKSNTK